MKVLCAFHIDKKTRGSMKDERMSHIKREC